ncbi:glycine-rich protein 5-like [Cimex lectularius]|uniref:Uncharacterized protein n=1 Tax=Cimex lectularius TaxID=79782 RepID=A0A8I6RNT0_CIMLE|nr:glycine-rich protein 5-like [Cimex lectularius]
MIFSEGLAMKTVVVLVISLCILTDALTISLHPERLLSEIGHIASAASRTGAGGGASGGVGFGGGAGAGSGMGSRAGGNAGGNVGMKFGGRSGAGAGAG